MKPKIRFKGFEGEWKEERLSEISSSIASGKNIDYKGPYPLYGSTGIIGTTDKPYHEGPMLLVARVGANAGFLQLVNEKCGVSDNTLIVKPKDPVTDNYLFQYFKFFNLNRFIYGSGQPLITGGMLKKMPVRYGLKEERETLIEYFTTLDSQISASTSRLSSLKQMKAASLQAMFPQEGETVPKMRFKGFEGEWKKVSFKDFTFHAGTKNRDNLPLESYSISNEFGFIPQNEQFENGGTMTQADKRMYYIVSPNSFAYNPARINVGSLGYYEGKEDVIVSSLYEVFKTDDTICDKFLLYWFKTDIFQKMIEQFQEGGVRLYFFYDKMCKCSLMRPPLAEQQAIASYFTSLDRQISLQSQRLEKLKQIKSACLDKMFV